MMSKLFSTMNCIKSARCVTLQIAQKRAFNTFQNKVITMQKCLFKSGNKYRGDHAYINLEEGRSIKIRTYHKRYFSQDMASSVAAPVPANNVLDILHAFQRTEILMQADKYGIFDKIDENKKPMDVDTLAKGLGVLPHTLERLLNACTALGLLKRSTSGKHILFANTPDATTYLTKKSPFNINGLIGLVKVVIQPGYKLEEPIKTGSQQIHKALDYETTAPDDFFKTLYGTKERFEFFVEGMDGYAKSCLHLFKELKLEKFKSAVDLGGSFGTHARTLKKMYKGMTVTLGDVKPVIQEAKKKPINKDAGINYAECDFFKGSSLPKADLFVLGHIIHDWDDKQCAQIISNVYNALNKGGAILVLDKVLNPNKDGPIFLCQQDLLMLAVTQGKERNEEEFKALITNQGFKNFSVKKDNNSPYYDAIMGHKL